jgi:ELWxxDGT repeat protein
MRLKSKIILPAIAYMLMFVVHANAEVILAKDIFPGVNSSNPSELINVNGTLFFAADNGTDGVELWKASGSGGTTPVRVKDINPGGSSSPSDLTNVNGTLFFAADDGTHGVELWKSNGTASGTLLVKDINNIAQESDNSKPHELTNVNGTLFFAADNLIDAIELWKSDGTELGTVLVGDGINPFGNSSPIDLVNVGGILFFVADDGTHGRELWKSDGTLAGTVLVKDINPGGGHSFTSEPTNELTNVNGTLFFAANDGTHGVELWKSNGTDAGTVLVKDIHPTGNSSPDELINVGGILFFTANDGAIGRELWRSDGTLAGTVLVKDITSDNSSSNPSGLTDVNGTLFFAADDDGTHGRELWKSDGTDAGTVEVEDIWPGTNGSFPPWPEIPEMINVGQILFFAANDGAVGRELWRHDPIAVTTELVKDINPGIGDSSPSELTNVNGVLFFAADDGSRGTELWRTSTADGAVVTDGGGCFIETAAFDMPHEIYAWILKAFRDK